MVSLLDGTLPNLAPLACQSPLEEWYQIKLHHRQRHTINHVLVILSNIQTLQNDLADHVESLHECTSTAVEAALCGYLRKLVAMFLPIEEHFRFHIPTPTLADQRHCQQFTVRTIRRRTRAFEKRSDLESNFIKHKIHPHTKIIEIVYHRSALLRVGFLLADTPISRSRTFCQSTNIRSL